MRYTLVSLDDKRWEFKRNIRAVLTGWDHVEIPAVDGRDDQTLTETLAKRGNPKVGYPGATVGQIGRWLTFLDHLDFVAKTDEPLLVVEDDSILANDFTIRFPQVEADVPDNADFFSLFVPRNKPADIYENQYVGPVALSRIKAEYYTGSDYVVKTYQPYGGVCMVLYPSLAEKMFSLVARNGIKMQFDDYLYHLSDRGTLNGYTVVPDMPDLAWITGKEESTVHTTKEFHG